MIESHFVNDCFLRRRLKKYGHLFLVCREFDFLTHTFLSLSLWPSSEHKRGLHGREMRSTSKRESEGIFLLRQVILKRAEDKDMKKETWFRPWWYGNVNRFGIKDMLILLLGSRGRRQGGASWPMENYFQAEAFNLDKVLDEFEQNEGELLR